MKSKTAVVVAFERLPLGLLGCYGRIPSPTPHIDRCAADAVVFDWHFAENTDPDAAGHAWWTGHYQFPLAPAMQKQQPGMLFEGLAAAGVKAAVVRETSSNGIPIPRSRCAASAEVAASPGSKELFREASARLAGAFESDQNRLLWILSAGMGTPHERPTTAETQIRAIDESFGRLYESVRNRQRSTGSDTLLIVTAAGGSFENGSAAGRDGNRLPANLRRLAQCHAHTPLLVHDIRGHGGLRQSSLVQSVDLAPTLLEWFGVPCETDSLEGRSLLPLLRHDVATAGREYVCFGDGLRSCGIRTRDFCLMVPWGEGERTSPADADAGSGTVIPPNVRLFVKPDDAWEVHNVAEQEPATVARLLDLLRGFVAQRTSGGPFPEP